MVDQSLLLRGRKLLSSFKFLGRFSSGSRVEECLSDLIRQFAGYYSVYAGFWRFSWVLVLALGLEVFYLYMTPFDMQFLCCQSLCILYRDLVINNFHC
ncbi:hypothetical protein MtrunA17_Chr3g0077871 [Medicago truncatula]|uniref:Transmembrane protein n=1 Tax=Medicago truncatula TaxID=3880 RepID=A0A396II01_MEDTR|nr:hypothetical protein MtrunA17_Chr3g0077871 [Medicago truncatula]